MVRIIFGQHPSSVLLSRVLLSKRAVGTFDVEHVLYIWPFASFPTVIAGTRSKMYNTLTKMREQYIKKKRLLTNQTPRRTRSMVVSAVSS